MENKKYFKALFANATFYAGLILGALIITAYAICSKFGFIDKFEATGSAMVVAVDVMFAIALLAFIIAAFAKSKSSVISFSEAFIGFAIALAVGCAVIAIIVKAHVFASVLVAVISASLAVILAITREKYYDHEYNSLEANATVKTYYKNFFKTYGLIAVVSAVAAFVLMILIEKSNVIGYVLSANSLKVVAFVALGGLLVLFAILYSTRIKSKEIGVVDVLLFTAIGAALGLIPVAFMVGEAFKVIAFVILAVMAIAVIVLNAIVIKNTHIYTEEENATIENKQTGFKAYFNALKTKVNFLVVVGVSAIISAVISYCEGIEFVEIFAYAVKLESLAIVNAGLFIFIALFALFVLADVKDYRVTSVDGALSVWNVTYLLLVLFNVLVFKGAPIYTWISLTGLVVGLALTFVRTRFVHYGDVVTATAVEETTAVETVEEAVEEPAVEVVATVEEAVEAPAVEVVATEEVAVEEPAVEVVATEEVAVEEPAVEVVATEEIAVEEPQTVVEAPIKLKRVNSKKIFENYVRTGDAQLKENYSAIKNAFYSYGVHSRLTKTRENFSKKGLSKSKVNPEKALHLQAKLQVRGKFVKLYINIDPSTLDAKYFRHKDVSDKSPDQATLVKIRSKLTLKRALELIDMLAVQEGYTKKKKFEPIDYAGQYTDENLTYMEKLGFDYMIKDSVTLAEVKGYNDEFAKKLVKTEIIAKPERYIYDEVTLDVLANNFADGEVADLEAMRAKGLIKINANSVTVKPSETLSKKLIVVANEIDDKAIEMIAIAGGESTQLIEG